MPLKRYFFINSGTSKNNKYKSTLFNGVLAIAYLQNLNKNNNGIPTFAQVRSKESAGRLVTDRRQNHKQKPTLQLVEPVSGHAKMTTEDYAAVPLERT